MKSAFFARFARHGGDIFEFIHIPRFFAAFKLFEGGNTEKQFGVVCQIKPEQLQINFTWNWNFFIPALWRFP